MTNRKYENTEIARHWRLRQFRLLRMEYQYPFARFCIASEKQSNA